MRDHQTPQINLKKTFFPPCLSILQDLVDLSGCGSLGVSPPRTLQRRWPAGLLLLQHGGGVPALPARRPAQQSNLEWDVLHLFMAFSLFVWVSPLYRCSFVFFIPGKDKVDWFLHVWDSCTPYNYNYCFQVKTKIHDKNPSSIINQLPHATVQLFVVFNLIPTFCPCLTSVWIRFKLNKVPIVLLIVERLVRKQVQSTMLNSTAVILSQISRHSQKHRWFWVH